MEKLFRLQSVARVGVRCLQSTAGRPMSMKEPYTLRGGSTEGNKGLIPGSPGYQEVLKYQKLWAVEDGTFVWQKTSTDKMLYNGTLAGCAAAVALCIYLVFEMSFPKKPQ